MDNCGDATAAADGVELGVRFRADVSGYISGIRFYKGRNNVGTHTGSLWDNGGNLLATATFTNESGTGWQEVRFATPVQVQPNVTYVASYHAPSGGYSVDAGYFVPGKRSGVRAAAAARARLRSRRRQRRLQYGPSGFPTSTFNASNYWVDVVFTTSEAGAVNGADRGGHHAGRWRRRA